MSDKVYSQTEANKASEKLTAATQIIAILAICTAIFGVGYQKGMILQMGLGNLSGNYELREIFNSAILGFLHLFNILINVGGHVLLKALLQLGITFTAISVFCGFLMAAFSRFNRQNLKKKLRKTRKALKGKFKKNQDGRRVYLTYSVLGAVLGVIGSVAVIFVTYLLAIFLTVLLIFPLMGYLVGAGKIKSEIDKPSCVPVSEKIIQANNVSQCTQVVINGKRLMGEVLLENREGYFLKRNRSFAFVSKDGKKCVFKKYYTKSKDSYSKIEHIDFKKRDKDLDEFCGST